MAKLTNLEALELAQAKLIEVAEIMKALDMTHASYQNVKEVQMLMALPDTLSQTLFWGFGPRKI